MNCRSESVVIAFLVAIVGSANGGDVSTVKVEVGKARPSWNALPGTDGAIHSLSDMKDKKIVVVAITCNHCPIAIEYFDRMKAFCDKYCGPNSDVALVAICVSNLESDKLPRMTEIAKQKALTYSYLHDETQQVAKELGATATPQFFVLGPDRTLAYRGAWDDSVNPTKAKSAFVESAVKALLSGKTPAITETRTIGCAINYK